jgi:1-acyl-sn-glycerol-3-phosphate acyltransferase
MMPDNEQNASEKTDTLCECVQYRHGMCFRMSYVFVSSILFWFPQCMRYFWRVFRFLFLERKQDSNMTSVKNVQGCF